MPIGHGASLQWGFPIGAEAAGRPNATPVPELARKSPFSLTPERPYRKPPLVGTPKSEKVIELSLVKELSKFAP